MLLSLLFFFRLRRPPSSPLFPYTTLFRSRSWSTSHTRPGQAATRWVTRGRRLTAYRGTMSRSSSSRASRATRSAAVSGRSEEHTSELQSRRDLVCPLLLEKKKKQADDG